MKKSCCFASQQIRRAIKKNEIIVPSFNESRIQPSSFDPITGNELFILDTKTKGLFRGNTEEPISRTLLKLPKRQRQNFNINDGFELKTGSTYLIPLEERVRLDDGEHIKSSPKSSLGRLFLNTRLLGDYNSCFDEINSRNCLNKEVQLWLFVQPLAFNIIMCPGQSLNQLRFFKGLGSQLTDLQIIREVSKNPLLYKRDIHGNIIPVDHFVTDGLEIHLDLSGDHTDGIIGLRARSNPMPIDLTKRGEYEAEDFFEPLKGKERISVKKGEYYLFSSSEILNIPSHLNVEMRSHSHIGLSGPLHFAGFIDNGFNGDLVFEVRSDEISDMILEDGMPINKLNVFRTSIPDKLYGPEIGSNYQHQLGPKPSKHFKPFDFAYAARNYEKLDRDVLVQDAKILIQHRKKKEGFEFLSPDAALKLFKDIEDGFFQSRYDCESDPLILQPIPYVLLFKGTNEIFTYVRSEDIKQYGDERLFGKHSIGLGGHINRDDGPDYIDKCLEREVMEEVEIIGNHSESKLVGTLMAYDKPVDRVHLGLVFVSHVDGDVKLKEPSATSSGMVLIEQLTKNSSEKYETWSKILIPYLDELSKY